MIPFIGAATIILDEARRARNEGAARERRRIRRSIMTVLNAAKTDHWDPRCECVLCLLVRGLDAATRSATRRGKR